MRILLKLSITIIGFALPYFAVAADALEVQRVTDGVYALVGDLAQRNSQNLANNATFGVVVTEDGVLLIDPGGSWKGAEAIHSEIRTLTDKPVKYVIDTGGQDHRWLGNGYWKNQGATIIEGDFLGTPCRALVETVSVGIGGVPGTVKPVEIRFVVGDPLFFRMRAKLVSLLP